MIQDLIPIPTRLARRKVANGRSFLPVQILLAGIDVLLVQASLVCAFWLRLYGELPILPIANEHELGVDHAWTLLLVSVLFVYIFKSNGLYRQVMFSRRLQQSAFILRTVTVAMVFLLSVTFMTKTKVFVERRAILVLAWLLLSSSEILVRCVFLPPFVRRYLTPRRSLIVGTGDCARQLLSRFSQDGSRNGIEILGMVEPGAPCGQPAVQGFPVLGTVGELDRIVESHRVSDIFIADLSLGPQGTLDVISRCRDLGVGIRVVSGLFEPVYPKIETEYLGTIPLVRLRPRPLESAAKFAKRVTDLAGASLVLILASPVLLLIAALIKITSRGPVFFVQRRTGFGGVEFDVFKFRTMRIGTGDDIHREFVSKYINGDDVARECPRTKARVNKLVGDDRITWIGRFLRKYSLDELPQLLNVVRGEMSLVGPRPSLPYEVALYRDWHKKRLAAIPGITGLWQVSGRNRLSFEEMVLLDLYYVENWSLALDLRILLKTIPVVIFDRAAH